MHRSVIRHMMVLHLNYALRDCLIRLYFDCFNTVTRHGEIALQRSVRSYLNFRLAGQNLDDRVLAQELQEHKRDYEDLETVQRLKLWLKRSLYTISDGWILDDVWMPREMPIALPMMNEYGRLKKPRIGGRC
ncbi:uncharacterized protein N7473_004165 [Penicillium subrubescens]|uniref:uncharacterized protein n=1 Tax=Penicillium subrubescens TaxID=1316194 RepID=UPI00254526DD|nr:uncharacterized protein N7473_004165 [Penicillium subrubescens]KAJ5907249.1 hypothetical protein N7473_004165 [Penicillium subrubescens]